MHRWQHSWCWLAILFLLTLPAVNVRLYASDEVQYFAFLRSLWFDRDVSFDNEYRTLYDQGIGQFVGFRETLLERTTPTGRRINFGTLGPALLWAPLYGLADAGVATARAFGSSVPRDGYSWPYLAAVCYGSAIYGFLGILLSARLARRLTGEGVIGAVAVWIGTPLLFYMYLAAGMAHAVSAFTVAAMLTVWLDVRERWRVGGTAALGAMAALIAMVREQDAILLAAPLADFLVTTIGRARTSAGVSLQRDWRPALAGLAGFAVVYAPQLLAYWQLNGRLGPSNLVTRKMIWTSPHALDVLFSPAHGFLFWTPLAALAIGGLCLLGRRRGTGDPRRIPALLLLAVAGHVYVSGCVQSWTVAGAFGQRRFVAITPMLVVGLSGLWRAVPAPVPRRLLAASIVVTVWWNLGMMALFGTRLMDRQRIELGRNAYDVFVTVPASAPRLAWRYITERESFYQRQADAK